MKACTGSIPVSGVDSCLERSEKLCGIAASLLRARHKTAADNSPRLFCLTRRQGAQIGRRASGELFVHAVLCSRREQASLGRTISELFLLCAHSVHESVAPKARAIRARSALPPQGAKLIRARRKNLFYTIYTTAPRFCEAALFCKNSDNLVFRHLFYENNLITI